jgi:hypothetical protein
LRLPPAYTISRTPEPIDWQLLTRVLDSVEAGRACAITELTSRFTNTDAVIDGLARLKENGLMMDLNGYLLPTIAAIAYRRLEREIFNPRQLRLPL